MTLSSEEMLVQSKVLAQSTDSNPNMVYKPISRLNKGLNPEAFSGSNSSIVNAINLLYEKISQTETTAINLNNKVNGVILDIDNPLNAEKWNALKEKFKAIDPTAETIIQALELLFNGKAQSDLLNLTADDNGKVLSVFVDELGKIRTKAIEITTTGSTNAQNVDYINSSFESLNTVEKALNYILANLGNGGTSPEGPISWEQILGKPDVPDTLSIKPSGLSLNSKEVELSTVPISDDQDITNIIDSLDTVL